MAINAYVRIRRAVRRIPRGRVATYGQVAVLAGLPGRARLVGYALHASLEALLPWHRVVNAEGRLSLARLDPAGGVTQRLRLEREGIAFDGRGCVRLALHRWLPRNSRKTAPISGRETGAVPKSAVRKRPRGATS